MPDQSGKVALVTGANGGLGYEISRGLAGKGAQVLLACRDTDKGQQVAQKLRKEFPRAELDVLALDLARLASIHAFADEYSRRYSRLDILCNNAGLMAIPYRQSADGYEMQFGVNHLGHFALTGLLLPVILKTGGQPRVVNVSSILHRSGEINFADLQSKKNYNPNRAYSQSKLANLLFTYELQRRLAAKGANAISVAAHPGYAATNLQTTGPRMEGSSVKVAISNLVNVVAAQSAQKGALPILYAATAPQVKGGDYIGPDGFMELRGYPRLVRSNEKSYDLALAQKLWTVSQELTHVSYL